MSSRVSRNTRAFLSFLLLSALAISALALRAKGTEWATRFHAKGWLRIDEKSRCVLIENEGSLSEIHYDLGKDYCESNSTFKDVFVEVTGVFKNCKAELRCVEVVSTDPAVFDPIALRQ